MRAAVRAAETARYRVEVPMRQLAGDDPAPRNVRLFTTKAEAAEWVTHATYAVVIEVETGELVESVAVRIRRGNDRGFVIWRNGKFDNAALIRENVDTRAYGYRELLSELLEALEA